ncbi:MAG TPA: SurA N-terminal domain-containing protein [Nitrospiria bacterium]|nr:SurA N-terminal domain-containing protein [Nitrospiria bacterium]
MIRFIRQRAVENPWVLRTIFGVIIVIFIISMGWIGFKPSSNRVVATVAGVPISLQEYEDAYRRTYEQYQNIFKDQFTPELIKQLDLKHAVINQLIDEQLWRLTARRLGLSVTDEELTAQLVTIPAFQRAGQFDPTVYEQTLIRNHWTPQRFEDAQRMDLLINKARAAVRASTALLPQEQPTSSPSPPAPPSAGKSAPTPPPAQSPEAVQQQKEERAVMAFVANLRAQTPITINEHLL